MEFFVLWITFCVLVAVWASKRGQSGTLMFFVALVISPLLAAIMVLLVGDKSAKPGMVDECGVAITPETHVKCPDCRSLIHKESRKCRHCGASLVPQ